MQKYKKNIYITESIALFVPPNLQQIKDKRGACITFANTSFGNITLLPLLLAHVYGASTEGEATQTAVLKACLAEELLLTKLINTLKYLKIKLFIHTFVKISPKRWDIQEKISKGVIDIIF